MGEGSDLKGGTLACGSLALPLSSSRRGEEASARFPKEHAVTNLALVAARLAEALDRDNVLFVADDDQQADALAAALAAIVPEGDVVFLPSSDALPGDRAPASPANVGRRVAALRRMRALASGERPFACVLSGEASARLYPAPEAFDAAPPALAAGDALDIAAFEATLADLGYFNDDRVDEPGEIAIRGNVIDIFPADAGLPARIEIADGRIADLRAYDPVSQRTVDAIERLAIGRAAEPRLDTDATTILAHLKPGLVTFGREALNRRHRFVALANDAAQRAGVRREAVDDATWIGALGEWREAALPGEGIEAIPRLVEQRSPLAALARFAGPRLADGRAFLLVGGVRDLRFLRGKVARRIGRDMPMISSWAEARALPKDGAAALVMPADAGFVDATMLVVAAADLLGSRALLGNDGPPAASVLATAASDIRIGDVVVHEDHGVGAVAGIEPMPGGDDAAGDAIALEYAGGARRLIAVREADRIWRYGADADAVSLDKLDGGTWAKRRGAIAAAIAESARGLAALAEARGKLTAPAMLPDPAAYERFAQGFAFNETADQARAITAVRDDLALGRPMDRLVVGDVGYGKTEVALRAAALAALAGYQVVVAAPTTVLVRQHIDTFQRRFEALGIAVAGLSRLSTAAEKKAVKAGLADGSIQVVIGTGAVMASDVAYAKLGLVIIDEEQRFGAADKTRLRGAGDIHLLTLTATPIPRTLQMAMVGLQQISIIATPPARRQPIRTSLDQFDDGRMRVALMREKSRGGQSFVVVPRIEDMADVGARLRRIAGDLAIVEAHGKMRAAEIDAVMVDFAAGAGDVLLATNIIEAGLDVPRANTMIVWRADRFGLAQLHQLRGRVGRGHRRGQVILLTDAQNAIGERTLKRLRTLAAFDRLGAGFDISAQDLDMRGAGDLLGETQAGHMKLIGADLYQQLLGAALREARGETVERWVPELNLGRAGTLPESWIPDVDIRLSLYVRLARIVDGAGLDAFEEELTDRFGPLPPETEILMNIARIGLLARDARIARVDAGPAAIALTPRRDFPAGAILPDLTAKGNRLLLAERTEDDARLDRVRQLLEDIAGPM